MRVLSSKEFEEHAEKVRTVGKGEAMHESGSLDAYRIRQAAL